MRPWYPVWIRSNGRHLGLIWQTVDGAQVTEEDTDAVLVLDGKIATATTAEALATLAAGHGIEVEDGDGSVLVLDGVEELLELPASEEICAQLLNAWNLFADIAGSVAATLEDTGDEEQRCYEKLFFGNNLPSVTPAGEHYRPYFTAEEQRRIQEVFTRCRAILATHL